MPLSIEHRQGRRDYKAGYGRTECPWTDPAKAAEWLTGWYAASDVTLH